MLSTYKPQSVAITWSSDESANESNTLGLCPLFTGAFSNKNNSLITSHVQAISNLANSTLYCFNTTACDSSSNCASANFSFTTATNVIAQQSSSSTSANEQNLVYDVNGNLVSGDGFYRDYNELNQLVRIRNGNLSTSPILEEFVWHPVEERILIKDVYNKGVKNYTIYYVSKDYLVVENQTGNYTEKYIYQDNVLVAQVNTNGNKEFVHNDHEGSTSLITDINGNIIENTFYSPFGEILSGGTKSRFDSEAKEFDPVTQLYDFHFRMYNPQRPPFEQPDTLIENVYDPQALNRYSFERNNPFIYIDENGHFRIDVFGLGLSTASLALLLATPSGGATIPTEFSIGLGLIGTSFAISSTDDARAEKYSRTLGQFSIFATGMIATKDFTQGNKNKASEAILNYMGVDDIINLLTAFRNVEDEEEERCELSNIDCGKDSRLKLKIDPTIDQDKTISEKPEEKEDVKPTPSPGGGGSPGGAPVGSHGCSYWEDCVVKSST